MTSNKTSNEEDYEDKTTLTSVKFEDESEEIWKLSKLSCLFEGLFSTLVNSWKNSREDRH